MTRYCIIGAGAAGLSALQQLREAGHEADCFEATDRVGGHWHTDYDALHLITARDQTHFEGFPMPKEYPHFPRRDLVREYIESYARHHGLYERIQFNTRVESVVPVQTEGPVGSAGWRVTLAGGEIRDYDGVFVANGHLWDTKVPAISQQFTGKQVHSGKYRNTDDIEGTRVLVVGAGNSGCDLAVDAAQHRFEVDIVMRAGLYFQPKSYFGVPRQTMPWLEQFSPTEQDFIARMLAKISIGDWRNYPGMPEPKEKTLAEGRSTVNDLLLYWIQHGRIAIRPGIESINGKTVKFSDGTEREYDTILWATGFHPSLPFLDDSLIKNEMVYRFDMRAASSLRGSRSCITLAWRHREDRRFRCMAFNRRSRFGSQSFMKQLPMPSRQLVRILRGCKSRMTESTSFATFGMSNWQIPIGYSTPMSECRTLPRVTRCRTRKSQSCSLSSGER
ncbi:MAG: flavin-containing monooxygenase [Gulosibacter sp.]|uniref:flavin-containing monooxygenase n=1 Tax=Gulosibacter sp. TaxID=2817531 RepID=UPI003F91BD43